MGDSSTSSPMVVFGTGQAPLFVDHYNILAARAKPVPALQRGFDVDGLCALAGVDAVEESLRSMLWKASTTMRCWA